MTGEPALVWVATGLGVLDVSMSEQAADGYELIVTPERPSPPSFLLGEGAEVWRMLAAEPVPDRDLSNEERQIAEDLRDMGLAALRTDREKSVFSVDLPWLESAIHELVYALVSRVASDNDIPIVFIKGPTLHVQGLRERRHSGDVDCWVLPGDDLRLAQAMRPWGWIPLLLPFTGTTITHSLSLVPPEWGCSIDVHTSFPGMRLDQREAFRALLETSETRSFAGVAALTPSRPVHAVLSALHEMRPFNGVPPAEPAVALAASVLALGGDAVLDVVDRFDAGYVLREPLCRSFPSEAHRYDRSIAPEDWSLRLESASSVRHLRALNFIPARQRLRALIRLVWPTAETTRIAIARPDASGWEIFFVRMRRAGVSVRKLINRR